MIMLLKACGGVKCAAKEILLQKTPLQWKNAHVLINLCNTFYSLARDVSQR